MCDEDFLMFFCFIVLLIDLRILMVWEWCIVMEVMISMCRIIFMLIMVMVDGFRNF